MRKFIGIDLHSNNSVVVVTDDDDRVLYQKRLPNDLVAIAAALAPHRDETVGVVIESTYNWYWLVDGLMDAGYRVHLAHPAAIKKYEGLKHSGDVADAAYWRSCCGWGCGRRLCLSARATRGSRSGAQAHAAGALSHGPGVIDRGHPDAADGKPHEGRGRQAADGQQVDGFGFARDVALALEANRAVSQALGQQIEVLEKRLKERVSLHPEYRLFKTVPGIGETLATTIMLETGSISRFAQVGNFSSYCRCVDSARESNGKKRAKATPATATSTCRGPLWRPPTSRCGTSRRPAASRIARRAGRIASWRSRRWRTSWRGPATTCCGTSSRSM